MKKFIYDNLTELFGVVLGLTCGTIVGAIAFSVIVLAFAILKTI